MKKPNRQSKMSVTDQEHDFRCRELEIENKAYKREIEELKCKLANLSPSTVDGTPKVKQETMDSKKKTPQSRLSIQRQKSCEVGRISPDDVQRLKAEKVQLLCKMKLQSMQFRISKGTLEKEILQLKKEQTKNAYEMCKLLALNQKQKLVLQRKMGEADIATKRLKEVLKSRKTLMNQNSDEKAKNNPRYWAIELELKVAERVEEMRSKYDRQLKEMAAKVMKYEKEAVAQKEESFRCLLENKEDDSTIQDSELTNLKEELFRLNDLISQMRKPKTLEVQQKKLLDTSVTVPSVSEKSNVSTFVSGCSGVNVSVLLNSGTEVCCSCSKKSLCKTTKCECRIAGGSCGENCGCTASKCSNRNSTSFKLDESSKPEVSQELVSLDGLGTGEGVMHGGPTGNNESEPKGKPLSNIANTLAHSSPAKILQKKKGSNLANDSKPLDHALLPANADDSTQEDLTAIANVHRKPKRTTRSVVA